MICCFSDYSSHLWSIFSIDYPLDIIPVILSSDFYCVPLAITSDSLLVGFHITYATFLDFFLSIGTFSETDHMNHPISVWLFCSFVSPL